MNFNDKRGKISKNISVSFLVALYIKSWGKAVKIAAFRPIGLSPGACQKPIRFFGFSDGSRSCAKVLNMNWIWWSCSSIFFFKSACSAKTSHNRTKARMIWIFTWTALLLCKTPESMATPSWVNAKGKYRLPPHLEVPKWNLKFSNSSFVSWNIKSSGNQLLLRLTDRLNALGSEKK